MNTAEKVARLEAYLHRLQENAKLPRPERRRVLFAEPAAKAVTVIAPEPDALRAAVADLEAARLTAERAAKEAADRAAREAAEIAAAAREAAERAAKEAAEREAARLAKEAADKAAKEAAERAAKLAAEKEAADRLAQEAADRLAREAAERVAKEAAERAAKEAADKAAKEASEHAAKEKAAKEAAERAAKEKAAKEASEHAAKEAADKAAKDKAAKEAADKAAKEAAEKAAKDKAAKEAAERAAKEAADKAAKDKAAKEAAERAAKDKAAKEAADKAAKEAAERAAKDKAAKEAAERAAKEKAAKEAADKAAKDKAAKEAAEKAAREKATREAAERAAKEATARAAKEAAAVPSKKQPATIDELFAELEFSGEPTKVGKGKSDELVAAVRAAVEHPPTPTPKPVQSAPPPLPVAVAKPEVKDEPTFDADQPTVVGESLELPSMMTKSDEPRALPGDTPTRVAEPFAGLIAPPTLEGPTVAFKPGVDRSPEPDEPTVIRRPTARDQAVLRGEIPGPEEEATVQHPIDLDLFTLQIPPQPRVEAEAITAAPIISIGEPESADKLPALGLHAPKVELADSLREAADQSARDAAERRAGEEALLPKPEPKEGVREEITTASRRFVQPAPDAVESEKAAREREQQGKKGVGGTVAFVVVIALLVGAGVFLGLRNGWFGTTPPPAPTASATTPARTTAAPPATAPATTTVAPPLVPTTQSTATPTSAPTAEPSVAGTAAAAANAKPGSPIVEKNDETAKLNATKTYLTVLSTEPYDVFILGKKIGPANKRHEISCENRVGQIRLGVPLPDGKIEWHSAGVSIALPCKSSITIAVPVSKAPVVSGGGAAPAPGGGGDPY